MVADASVMGYKLTKLVVEQYDTDPEKPYRERKLLYAAPHGPWIINPATVWMVEFMECPPEGLESP